MIVELINLSREAGDRPSTRLIAIDVCDPLSIIRPGPTRQAGYGVQPDDIRPLLKFSKASAKSVI